jgi:TonB-dependent receptor
LCRGGYTLLFALLFPLLSFGQASGGTITGQVSNSATKSYLEGAVVELVGTDRSTITDREGRYQFDGVATGSVTVAVGFTGLDKKQVPVSVGAGQRVVQDFELTSEIYKLEKFTVAGEREGTAKAEALQRQAANVKAIVSSDTFGNVADGNIGDMLQHMAGLTADYNGPDVRQVSIRGVGSALNSVTMDGQQVASAQSAGTGRQFEFEQASLGNIETIEVTKAPTPDMDGASIGGSVNLVTKSAFDRSGGRLITFGFGFTAQPGYNGPTSKWKQPIRGLGPSANFSYQEVFGANRNLGITLTGLMHSQAAGGGIINSQFERNPADGPAFNWQTARIIVNGATRTRAALGLKVDYRFSDHATLSFNTSYNFFHENNDTRNHTLQGIASYSAANIALATVDAAGNRTGGGFIAPGYTSNYTKFFANPGASSVITMTSNDKAGRTILFSPMMRHRLPHGLAIDYGVSYSQSATWYDISHNNDKYESRPKGTITYRLNNIGYSVDRSKDTIWPTIAQTQGPSFNNLANYTFAPGATRVPVTDTLQLAQTDLRGYDTVVNAKFDLKKDLALALPTYVKTGFTVQNQKRKLWQDPRRYNYTGPDGVLNTDDDNEGIAQFLEVHDNTDIEKKYLQDRGGVPPWVNPYGVARHQKLYPEMWKEDIAFASGKLTSRLLMDETISAAYVMGNVRYQKLSLLTGIRFENTEDKGEGPLSRLSPAEAARRAAWVGPVSDAEQRRRNIEQFGGRYTNTGKYQFFLPGAHLKFQPFDGLVTRLSWSTGVGRPAFGSIIPNTVINDTAETVTVTNPELKPQYGKNWDLTAEYYFKPQGMISIGAFRKNITDYIATNNSRFVEAGQNNGFDGQYVGYRIITTINDGYARIEGLEASYQQQLTFLPGWTRGFGLYANYTKLRTEGQNSSFTTGPSSSAGGTLAGFLDTTGNIGLGYRGFGMDLRLQTVYRGKYLVANSTDPALVTWQEPKWSWTWKSRYNFSKGLGVFLDLENMFSTPLDRRWAAYPGRVTSYRTFATKIVGGVTGRF